MRFLKNKVRLSQQKNLEAERNSIETSSQARDISTGLPVQEVSPQKQECSNTCEYLLPIRKPRQKPSSSNANSKNIVKNYGKAFCMFASSEISIPYFNSILNKRNYHNIKTNEFMQFFKIQKEKVNNIESLRKLLIVETEDTQEMSEYKTVFQQLCVTFLKYFSVNWIYSGRLLHKDAHLKARFKMMRRVQNPEFFTYLNSSAK